MGIFESRESKEYKKKQQLRQAVRKLKKHNDWLDKQRDMYIQRAKEAMIKGMNDSYGIARSGLKATLVQRKRADEMLLSIELLIQQKDFAKLSGTFVKGMDQVSKELSRESSQIDFMKASQVFNKAMGRAGIAADNLDDYLEGSADAFADLSGNESILDQEIDRLIGIEAAETVKNESKADMERLLNTATSASTKVEESLDDDISKRLSSLSGNNGEVKKKALEAIDKPPFESDARPSRIERPTDRPTDRLTDKPTDRPTDKPTERPGEKKGDPFDKKVKPEEAVLDNPQVDWSYKFNWDKRSNIVFNDIAGLEDVKTAVKERILDRLQNPDKFKGYELKNTSGLLLIGPPGTGKTMVAAAIANEVDAKFCAVKKGEILNQGVGNSEKAIKALFSQARSFKCAVICFDEIDAIVSRDTRSSIIRSVSSEFFSEKQGMDEYYKKSGNMLYIIGTTNKPWDIETAFMRTGRFDDRIYVGLPDEAAREYMLRRKIQKINDVGIVKYDEDIDYGYIVALTNGFNGADINNLLEKVQIESANRIGERGERIITMSDFEEALKKVKSSVRAEDIEKLHQWMDNA